MTAWQGTAAAAAVARPRRELDLVDTKTTARIWKWRRDSYYDLSEREVISVISERGEERVLCLQ